MDGIGSALNTAIGGFQRGTQTVGQAAERIAGGDLGVGPAIDVLTGRSQAEANAAVIDVASDLADEASALLNPERGRTLDIWV